MGMVVEVIEKATDKVVHQSREDVRDIAMKGYSNPKMYIEKGFLPKYPLDKYDIFYETYGGGGRIQYVAKS